MSESYIEDIVKALFKGDNHRKFVLKEVQRRIVDEIERLAKEIIDKKENKSDWWKNKLILDSKNRDDIIWYGGLNKKTLRNLKTNTDKTTIEVVRKLCAENYDAIKLTISELPKTYPIPELSFYVNGSRIVLDKIESFLFLFTIMSMSKALTGGIWSEVGKQASNVFIKKCFIELNISDESNKNIYYKLGETLNNREVDATVYHKGRLVLKMEIKILGGGNPEIVGEAIAVNPNIFIVDQISPRMQKEVNKKKIKTVHFYEATEQIKKYLENKGISL